MEEQSRLLHQGQAGSPGSLHSGACEAGMTLKGALSTGKKELAQLLQSQPHCLPSYKAQEAGDREAASGHWLRCMVTKALG